MGLGYALTEDFPTDPETGFPTFSTLRQLGILRAKDVPEIEVELVEVPQPKSPYGIKGVGEIGLVPTAPAVAAALHDLDGQWRTTLPMKAAPTAIDGGSARHRGHERLELAGDVGAGGLVGDGGGAHRLGLGELVAPAGGVEGEPRRRSGTRR